MCACLLRTHIFRTGICQHSKRSGVYRYDPIAVTVRFFSYLHPRTSQPRLPCGQRVLSAEFRACGFCKCPCHGERPSLLGSRCRGAANAAWHPAAAHRKYDHIFWMDNAHNIEIDGITCIVRSRTWKIQMRDSRNIGFYNLKVIGRSANNANPGRHGLAGRWRYNCSQQLLSRGGRRLRAGRELGWLPSNRCSCCPDRSSECGRAALGSAGPPRAPAAKAKTEARTTTRRTE
jgi:hypothetical protein